MSANRSSSKLAEVTPGMMDINFGVVPRGIRVGGVGNLTIVDKHGTETTIKGCLQGEYVPCYPSRIVSATTTATDLTLFY